LEVGCVERNQEHDSINIHNTSHEEGRELKKGDAFGKKRNKTKDRVKNGKRINKKGCTQHRFQRKAAGAALASLVKIKKNKLKVSQYWYDTTLVLKFFIRLF